MTLCHATTFIGKPCDNAATIGEYCVIHAGGWDHFKANVTMLYTVYTQVTAALGIISMVIIVVGAGRIFKVMHNGETRSLNLDEMKDRAETLIGILDLFAGMEDPRNEIENIDKNIIRLHEDVLLLVEHLAKSYRPAQALELAEEAQQSTQS